MATVIYQIYQLYNIKVTLHEPSWNLESWFDFFFFYNCDTKNVWTVRLEFRIWLAKFVYSHKRSFQDDALATLFSDKFWSFFIRHLESTVLEYWALSFSQILGLGKSCLNIKYKHKKRNNEILLTILVIDKWN